MLTSLLVFGFILSLLIFVHEFGHYITARLFHVKVYEFAIGFGPKIFQIVKGGIKYTLRAIPFGGYVDLEEKKDRPQSIVHLSLFKQYLIVFGGIILNLLLAFFLLTIYLSAGSYKIKINLEYQPIFARSSVESSYAIIVGLTKKTHLKMQESEIGQYAIVAVDGKEVTSSYELIETIKKANQNGRNKVELTLFNLKDRTTKETEVLLNSEGRLGVLVTDYKTWIWDYSSYGIISSFVYAVDISTVGVKIIKNAVGNALSTKDTTLLNYSVGGPVAVYSVVDSLVRQEESVVLNLIHFTGLLSLNLALINVLPFPPLDGWQALSLTLRKRVKYDKIESILKILTYIGAVFLVLLSVLITIKDIKMFFITQ